MGLGFYYFGTALHKLQTPLDIVIGVLALLAFVGGVIVLRRKESEVGEAAERAYPGRLD